MSEQVLTVPELLQLLRIGRSTMYRQITLGHIPPPIKLSSRRNGWLKSDIEEMLKQRRVAANNGQ